MNREVNQNTLSDFLCFKNKVLQLVYQRFIRWAKSLNSVTNSDVTDTDGVEVQIEL